jgi:polyadenylate-binding protein
LYVGDLPESATESEIYDMFLKENINTVRSIRVCRDMNTRTSLGYAYVNFEDEKKAEQALETLRTPQIAGKPCRIMWSMRDPSIRKSGVGNIFIKNLEANISNEDLYHFFLEFIKGERKSQLIKEGNVPESINISDADVKDEILSCKVACDRNGKSKGYGFVHFQKPELAEKAKQNFNGYLFNDKPVYVGDFIPRQQRAPPRGNQETFTNIYTKDLDKETIRTSEDLENLFKEFGTITSAKLMTDTDERSKGFGFVNFENHESAVRAIEGRRNFIVNGKTIYVARALSRQERDRELELQKSAYRKGPQRNLYVKHLFDDINDVKLRELFSQYGTITSAKVMLTEQQQSKGFGFVCFSTSEEANNAKTAMNQKNVDGKPLYVAFSQPRSERRRQLELLHARGNPRGGAPSLLPGYPYPYLPYGRGFPSTMHQMFPVMQPQSPLRQNRRPPMYNPVQPVASAAVAGRGLVNELLAGKDPIAGLHQISALLASKKKHMNSQRVIQIDGLIDEIEREINNGGDQRKLNALMKSAFQELQLSGNPPF